VHRIHCYLLQGRGHEDDSGNAHAGGHAEEVDAKSNLRDGKGSIYLSIVIATHRLDFAKFEHRYLRLIK